MPERFESFKHLSENHKTQLPAGTLGAPILKEGVRFFQLKDDLAGHETGESNRI